MVRNVRTVYLGLGPTSKPLMINRHAIHRWLRPLRSYIFHSSFCGQNASLISLTISVSKMRALCRPPIDFDTAATMYATVLHPQGRQIGSKHM